MIHWIFFTDARNTNSFILYSRGRIKTENTAKNQKLNRLKKIVHMSSSPRNVFLYTHISSQFYISHLVVYMSRLAVSRAGLYPNVSSQVLQSTCLTLAHMLLNELDSPNYKPN